MFSRSSAALVANLGETCESSPLQGNEVTVDDEVEQCLPGYCVARAVDPGGSEGEGICTCRCDGPAGATPLCDCSEGFHCEEVIKPIGGLSGPHLEGSYCLADR